MAGTKRKRDDELDDAGSKRAKEETFTCSDCGKKTGYYDTKVLPGGNPTCSPCMLAKFQGAPSQSIVVACPQAKNPPTADPSLLNQWEPPIELMTYKEGQKRQKAKDPALKDMQLEHGIPNSAFIQGKGRKGATVAGAEGYSEGDALIFPVHDDQTPGTEHKFLTDRERAYQKDVEEKGQWATLDQHLRMMEPAWADSFVKYRKYTGKLPKDASESEKQAIIRQKAQETARALGQAFSKHFAEKLEVDSGTGLKNGLAGRNADPPPANLRAPKKYSI
jgi:hypothetical protein